ncbi:MAG: DinB family protein [Stellaceae bacterium]
MPSDYFAVLAQHSAWANRRLYQSCEALAPAEYLRERGSVYGSLHAALNHILATDRLWIGRIEGRSQPAIDEHQILYADLVALKVARLAEDERLRLVISGLTTGALDVPVYYTNRHGDRFETPLRFVLGHLFDNQSRCRGEALALLAQAGATAPALDLIAFLRETQAVAGR